MKARLNKYMLAAGNPQKKALSTLKPGLEIKLARPTKPHFKNPIASQCWDRLADELEDARLLTKNDGPALAAMCHSMARISEAQAEVEKEGSVITYETKEGNRTKVSPWLQIAWKEQEFLGKMFLQFGMTPAAREKITDPDKSPEGGGSGDPDWDVFENGAKEQKRNIKEKRKKMEEDF